MRRLLPLLDLAAALTGASAGTQLVLEDGQVIEGADVRRDGDLYVIVLDSGGSMTIPASLVSEVRLSAAEPTGRKTESGTTQAAPQTLAGQPIEPLQPSEAQAVFGEPARFRPSVIDPTWKPESGFPEGDVLAGSRSSFQKGVIDPTWKPESGFPDRDVLAGSRSTWSEGMDNTWVPEDGFKKKRLSWEGVATATTVKTATLTGPTATGSTTGTIPSGARVRMTGARTLVAASEPVDLTASMHGGWYDGFAPSRTSLPFHFRVPGASTSTSASLRDCARTVLQASGPVAVAAVSDARYSVLPIHVYRASDESDDGEGRAAFTVEGGTCRAISGDLRDSLGVRLTRSYTMSRGVEAYDRALEGSALVRLKSPEDKIDYAFGVVSLIDPDVAGSSQARLELLVEASDLEALADAEPEACSLSGSRRRKEARRALHAFAPPEVLSQGAHERVEFFTWSSANGDVVRHTVLLDADGQVSVKHEPVASHVGAHTDRED